MNNINIWKTSLILIPFILLLGLGLDIYIPAIPHVKFDLNINHTTVQKTLSYVMYAFAFGQLIMGPISNKIGRENTIILSCVIFCFGSILILYSKNINYILIGRIMQGLGASGTMVACLALVQENFNNKDAQHIYMIIRSSMAFAPSVAPIIGASITYYYHWRSCFIFLAIYSSCCTLWAIFKLKKIKGSKEVHNLDSKNNLSIKKCLSILKNTDFLFYTYCAIFAEIVIFGYFSLAPKYFAELYAFSELQFGFVFSLNAMASLFTGIFIGNRIKNLDYGILCAAIGFIIASIMMIIMESYFPSYLALVIPNLIASGASAIFMGAATAGAMKPFTANAGIAASLFCFLEFIIGGFLGSTVIETPEPSNFILSIFLALGGISTILFLKLKEKYL